MVEHRRLSRNRSAGEDYLQPIALADEKGNVVTATYYGMSPDFPLELQITLRFEEYAGKTRMTLRHTGLPQGETTDMCRQGWSESFRQARGKLKRRISAGY